MASRTITWMIVDGYSLLHRDPELKPLLNRSLMFARQQLVRKIEQVADAMAEKTTIVFDGKSPHDPNAFVDTSLDILFAPGNLTADTVIERIVYNYPEPARILVVTSDRSERETVMAAGAASMSCGVFLETFQNQQRRIRRPHRAPTRGQTLGDAFPPDTTT